MTDSGAQTTQSLVRGLAVLRAFGADQPVMSAADVARATDLSRATATRILATLEHLGYVRADGRTYSLAPRVLELGFSYLSGLAIPAIAQPHLDALAAELGESTSLSVLDGSEIVYVARSSARRIMAVSVNVGTRLPAYATSMGRVLLSALPEPEVAGLLAACPPQPLTAHTQTDATLLTTELSRVAERGWSLVDQELEEGLRSIAVAVRRGPRVIAAMNVAVAVTSDGPADLVTRFLPRLESTAATLSAEIQWAN